MTVSAMLSAVTPIGTRAKYGTTPSPSAESAGCPSSALMPMTVKSNSDSMAVDVLAVPEGQGDRRGDGGLGLDRLVDGHRLRAEQDVLDPRRGGVLAADRHRTDAGGLHAR